MDKIKKEAAEEVCSVYRCEIIQMVGKIRNQAILESTYSFIMGLISTKEKQEAG